MAPKRDIVATDGMKITLGGTTVTIWLTPGHTPGTLSYTFTVLDRGKPVNVAYSGGTAFNFVNNTPDPGIRNFQTYIDSQKHMAEKARASGATVLLSNHSEFDNAVNKNRMLAGRGNGPHPYEVGAEVGAALFPGHAGLCAGGAAPAGAETGVDGPAIGWSVEERYDTPVGSCVAPSVSAGRRRGCCRRTRVGRQ